MISSGSTPMYRAAACVSSAYEESGYSLIGGSAASASQSGIAPGATGDVFVSKRRISSGRSP
jgi:hypothetical protein